MKTPTLFEKRHSCKYEDVANACIEQPTMVHAAKALNIPYKTFIRIAKKLNCYKPNPGGKGMPARYKPKEYSLSEIFEGKCPQYTSSKLRVRLIKEGIKNAECEICGITEWNGLPAPLELDHIDGNNSNNLLSNLRIICPNCHHQTPTHSCKKRK
jgi:hypothetical protein